MKRSLFHKVAAVLSLVLLVTLTAEIQGQCAMCKMVVESSDNGVAAGLNSGILYLMGIPYLLLMGVGVLLFRRSKAQA